MTAKLSAYMSEAANRPLPDDVIEKTKQHILDTFAAMISGSQLLPGRAAISFARNYGGEKVATVVCSNQHVRRDSRPLSPTACSPTRTKPTTRTAPRARTRAPQ